MDPALSTLDARGVLFGSTPTGRLTAAAEPLEPLSARPVSRRSLDPSTRPTRTLFGVEIDTVEDRRHLPRRPFVSSPKVFQRKAVPSPIGLTTDPLPRFDHIHVSALGSLVE
jgi:hypothetical protein